MVFKIKKRHISAYVRDCRLWEKDARKHSGFLGYYTLSRTNQRGHYASCYVWESERDHHRFMKKHHDRLVSLSSCPVEVVGYYDFKHLSNGKMP